MKRFGTFRLAVTSIRTFAKYLTLSLLFYFMFTSSYLHGYRNRLLSNFFAQQTVKRPASKLNLSFLSNIRSYFDEKTPTQIVNTIRLGNFVINYFRVPHNIETAEVKYLIPELVTNTDEITKVPELLDTDEKIIPELNLHELERAMSINNYAIARIPEEGDKLYLTVFWNNYKLKMERDKNETIGVTLARLKRNLAKVENGKYEKNKKPETTSVPEYSVSFLTNLFKTFEENSICEDTILKSSFISINDNLLKLFTNVPKLERVKLLPKSMVDCPVLVMIKDEEDKIYKNVNVEWLDSEGTILGNNLMFIPNLSDLGKNIRVRVTNNLMKYDVFESNPSNVDMAPYCPWQLDRIHKFNTSLKNMVTSPLQNQDEDLRVVSFNILSPTYLSSTDPASNFFPYCPTEYIDANYRNQLIGREINYLNADILCLQECSLKVYNEYLNYLFSKKYHSWFTIKGGNAGEGCAMFVNRSTYEPLDLLGVYFKDAMKTEEYKPVIQRLCNNWLFFNDNYFDKYHTAYQFGLYRNKKNNKYVIVSNTHLYFHPMASHVRLLQTYVLLNELEKFKQNISKKYGFNVNEESYTLICGDFNSFPNESIYNFMTNGYISYNHPDWKLGETFVYDKNILIPEGYERPKEEEETDVTFGEDKYLMVENYQGYTDSYKENQLPFTNYCQMFNGTLDFIFHSNNIKVKRTMPGITAEEASEHVGLPSKLYPSDHLSIAADF